MPTIREICNLGIINPLDILIGSGTPKAYVKDLEEIKLRTSFLNPKALVGIEFEIENVTSLSPRFQRLVIVDEDGSLRNNGKEFKTHVGTNLEQAAMIAKIYGEEAAQLNWQATSRCSVHVHYNVLDWQAEEVTRLLHLYVLFEKAIFKYVGRGRGLSNFCVPNKDWMPAGFSLGEPSWSMSAEIGRSSKYSALSLHRMFDLGTVEWRQMHGTTDGWKIIQWLEIIDRMMCYAKNANNTTFYKLVDKLNTDSNYLMFAGDVLGPLRKHFDDMTLIQSIAEGSTWVKLRSSNLKLLKALNDKIHEEIAEERRKLKALAEGAGAKPKKTTVVQTSF